MDDVIHNRKDRKKFCDTFTGGRMCKVTGLIVPKFFCDKICHGKPEEVQFPPEIKHNIRRYQERVQAITVQLSIKRLTMGTTARSIFGPRAPMVLRPFLLRPAEASCFSPAEAEAGASSRFAPEPQNAAELS